MAVLDFVKVSRRKLPKRKVDYRRYGNLQRLYAKWAEAKNGQETRFLDQDLWQRKVNLYLPFR